LLAGATKDVTRVISHRQGNGHSLARNAAGSKGSASVASAEAEALVMHQTEPLSPPEVDVLREAANGFTIKQTARKHFRAVETVKSHRQAVLKKLGARNTTHAVSIALGCGLIDASEVA
jgi:DNA-binding NarL/FixJ family response regulator